MIKIPLHNRAGNVVAYTIIDDIDSAQAKYPWCLTTTGYARRRKSTAPNRSKIVRLHREITAAKPNQKVDHINGDILDNRRANLRVCSHAKNMYNQKLRSNNTTGFKGVSYGRREGTFRAYIVVDNKQIWLGQFKDPAVAARAYDKAAKHYHGKFARLNFPKGV